MNRPSIFTVLLLVFLSPGISARAQTPAPPPAPGVQLRSGADLDQMLGPIALYPDPLIAQLLPAATLPPEIVLADRYVNGGGDPNLIDQQPWDPSVKALARYPAVLKWMDDNLAWTTALGQAFLYQQQDVMDSIQRLRAQAQALGNLPSTPQETVITDNGAIEIVPANPQVMYVPVYQPQVVYYQRPYGSPFISFGVGLAVGLWLNHDFDWHNHHLVVWHHDQPRPADWWYHPASQRPRVEVAHATVWQPHSHPAVVVQGLDRGWNAHPARSTVTVIGGQSRPAEALRSEPPRAAPSHSTVTVIGSKPAPAERRQAPPVRQSAPVVVQHPAQARPATGALIGVQSSQETRQFSSRGQESRQAVTSRPAAPAAHSAAPAHSAPPSRPSSGGKR
jgi:Protein of unknown function (DUF3300)